MDIRQLERAQNKVSKLQVLVTPMFRRMLKRISGDTHINESELVRLAMEEYLQNHYPDLMEKHYR